MECANGRRLNDAMTLPGQADDDDDNDDDGGDDDADDGEDDE